MSKKRKRRTPVAGSPVDRDSPSLTDSSPSLSSPAIEGAPAPDAAPIPVAPLVTAPIDTAAILSATPAAPPPPPAAHAPVVEPPPPPPVVEPAEHAPAVEPIGHAPIVEPPEHAPVVEPPAPPPIPEPIAARPIEKHEHEHDPGAKPGAEPAAVAIAVEPMTAAKHSVEGAPTGSPQAQPEPASPRTDAPAAARTDATTASPASPTDAPAPARTDATTASPASPTDAPAAARTDATTASPTDAPAPARTDAPAAAPRADAPARPNEEPRTDIFDQVASDERRVRARRESDRRLGSQAELSEDGWPLEPAEAPETRPPTNPVAALAAPTPSSALPSPAAAAFEAARIVGEIVGGDIESVHGAAMVAAAAAGAAIEAVRARAAAGELDPSTVPPSADASTDPVVTVRMQRDRILRALAEDIAATATSDHAQQQQAASTAERAQSTPAPGGRSKQPTDPPLRAPSRPGTGDGSEPVGERPADERELDPVAIAAAAISRLRNRARTDLAELRVHYHRHDVVVLLLAFVLIAVAGRVHYSLVTPDDELFTKHGLTFEHSQGWLTAEGTPLPAPRIAHDSGAAALSTGKPDDSLYHAELTSTVAPNARIEVLIDKKPAWSNTVTVLDLDRRTRWGELYTLDDSSVRSVEEHQWLRTAYRYAHVADKGDVPRIDHAVEYATIDREQIYVVTFFGTPAEIDRIEDVVAPSLKVESQTGYPLVPQTGHLSGRTYPNAVARAFDSTVMVVVADIVDGRLKARGGGSGVVVGSDGSILTNYHVIHDKNGRLHDVFVIGRFSEQDKAPQLQCAGKPSRSKLQREIDLALIKCDLDLDGRTWNPINGGGVWPTLLEARTTDIKMGQRLWVLGYPDVGGGGLTLSEGEVEGWSGVDGSVGKDFIKTDAAIRHGNSGGPVVDDRGRLVGIASAVRTKINSAGELVETVQAGGRVRPIVSASDLLAIAATGWTPREGHTDVDLQPTAVEAPAEGIRIQTHVLDAANETPVRDALVMVLRPGVSASSVDVNRLDDQVLAYGRSNAQGEVLLKQPVPIPGKYTVMVVARGYEPLIGENELNLDAKTPAFFDPWGKIWLRSR